VRDPAGINSRTEAAIELAVEILHSPAKWGMLDGRHHSEGLPPDEKEVLDSMPDDPDDFEAYMDVFLNTTLPEHVRDHVCRVLLERKPNFSKIKTDRNVWIAAAVEMVRERGFAYTRSHDVVKSNEPYSACGIVTAALARLGIHIPERTIEDIWGARDVSEVASEVAEIRRILSGKVD
jgi:hypothetical protein